MRFSFKRTIRALLIFLVIPPITLILIVALLNHAFNLVSLFNLKVSDEEVAILRSLPEAPLPGDDAFDKVLGIANQIDGAIGKAMKERNCFRWSSDPFDPGCMAFLETQADRLKAFDEWLAGPSPFKLERPKDLGRHGRFLLREFTVDSPIPNFLPFLNLSKLLALRSLKMMQMGRMADAEQDLRTIFALSSFLQQSPLLVSQVIGWRIRDVGLWLIVRHLGGGFFGEGFETMLADLKNDIEMFRRSIRLEGLPQYDFFKNEKYGVPLWITWLIKLAGLYNKDLTWKLYLSKYHLFLDHLDKGRLGDSYWEGYYGCKSSEGLIGFIGWLPNLLGRYLVCMPTVEEYSSKLGQAIDRIEATRVVIAARRFRQERGFWPTQEADLVPKYIGKWPKSALDGQPIRWLDNRSGVRVLNRDGKNFCFNTGRDLCEFPFEPPQPLGIK